MRRSLPTLTVLAALALAGCGGDAGAGGSAGVGGSAGAPAPGGVSSCAAPGCPGRGAGGRIPLQDVRAVPIGRSPRFKPPAPAPDGAPRAGLRCGPAGARFGVHLELFAAGRVIVVPAGIGVAPPRRREGAYVRGGRCRYPLATTEPTGVVEILHGTRATLGDLFALWGEPLSRRRIASFRGEVRAWAGGRRVAGDPRAIPLRHHAQIVLAIGPDVPVHSAFAFREGL